ncbi:MAG: nitrate reductase associated protein [Candidatus Binatia bacterium]
MTEIKEKYKIGGRVVFYRYRFESEIYPSLSLIPLHVRMKLDITGIKISLRTWLAFSLEERWVLCHLPVETAEEKEKFTSYLAFLTRRYLGEEPSPVPLITDLPWEDRGQVPDNVRAKSEGVGRPVALEEWAQWNTYQRYALLKLSLSKNEPEQFYEALREFRQGSCGSS